MYFCSQRPALEALVLSFVHRIVLVGFTMLLCVLALGWSATPARAQSTPTATASPSATGNREGNTTATPSVTEAVQTTATATPSIPTPISAIQRIRDRGDVLVVGAQYDLPPLSYINDSGEFSGFEIDLVGAMAGVWGVDVEFVPVTPQDRVQRVNAGEVDLILLDRYAAPRPGDRPTAGAGLDPIDVSLPYFSDRLRILTRLSDGYEFIDELSGATVGTIAGVSTSQFADYVRTERIALDTQLFQEYTTALAALSVGEIDALVAPGSFLAWTIQESPEYTLLEQPLSRQPLVMGFAAGDPYFHNLIDYTLQRLQEEEVYETIFATWFPDGEPLTIATLPGTWPFSFTESPTTTLPAGPSHVQQFTERETLLVGIPYDLPPFGYAVESGEVLGFDAALAAEFAERWLGDAGAVDLVPVTAQTKGPLLAAGEVDLVIAQMVQTWESEELVDFSQAYFVDQLSLLVRSEDALSSFSDLNGRIIGVVDSESSLELLRSRSRERGIDVEVLPFQEHAVMVQALQAEQIDAVMLLGMAAFRLAQEDETLQVLDIPNSAESYNIGVPEGDAQLLELVDETLQALRRDGTYDALYREWFTDEGPLSQGTPLMAATTGATTGTTTGSETSGTESTATESITASAALTTSTGLTTSALLTPTAPAITGALTETTPITTDVPITSLFITNDPTGTISDTTSETGSSPVSATDLLREAAEEDPDTITHVVAADESLTGLADHYYEDPDLWQIIYEVNQDVIGLDPNVLLAGTVLLIPDVP